MKKSWVPVIAMVGLLVAGCAAEKGAPRVTLYTSAGEIVIELFPEDSPITVENFLTYLNEGFYDGLIFHRAVPGFVIQAGGYMPGMVERPATHGPIQNESTNGVSNARGTISMARMPAAHTADSQFFISLVDNSATLDRMTGKWGYAVFGRVVEGMSVVDGIGAAETMVAQVEVTAQTPTGADTTFIQPFSDVPVEPVVIDSARMN